MRILIATYPFGKCGKRPQELLEASGHELIYNPLKRRLKAGEVNGMLDGIDAVIAGTEPYNTETLKDNKTLKVISRVGIGLDSVDLEYCREHKIMVTYTPEAPSDGVAELAVGNIIGLLRHTIESDHSVRKNAWNRLMGSLVKEVKIGIVGVGRIGSRVINLLQPFKPNILATDIDENVHGRKLDNVTWCDFDTLISTCDVISLHIPLNKDNYHLINREAIGRMKTGAMLINTARGAIVEEEAITDALVQKHLGGAALDVFENEPYEGKLAELDNVILTAHIGASAHESRYKMELGAAEDCLRVLAGENALEPAY
jgi:D-3-phosphoglycerate dehydrogenase